MMARPSQALDYLMFVKGDPESWVAGLEKEVAGTERDDRVVDGLRIQDVGFKLQFRIYATANGWSDWAAADGTWSSTLSHPIRGIQFGFLEPAPRNKCLAGRIRIAGKGWQRPLVLGNLSVLGSTDADEKITAMQLCFLAGDTPATPEALAKKIAAAERIFDDALPKGSVRPPKSLRNSAPQEPIAGRWMWTDSKVECTLDSSGKASQPGLSGTWSRPTPGDKSRRYKIEWQNGESDTLEVNLDGSAFSGSGFLDGKKNPRSAARVDGLLQRPDLKAVAPSGAASGQEDPASAAEFEKLQSGYRQAVYRDVWDKKDAATKQLDEKYDLWLVAAIKEAGAGATADALESEKADHAHATEVNDPSLPSSLRELRKKYKVEADEIARVSESAKRLLDDRYAAALKAVQAHATGAVATSINAELEELEKTRGAAQGKGLAAAALAGRKFSFGRMGNLPAGCCVMTFLADGKLKGNSYPPNESYWQTNDEGQLQLLGSDHHVTTTFTTMTWNKDKVDFTGKFHDGATIFALRELTPVPVRAGLLTAARLAGTQFQFVTKEPQGDDYQTIRLDKKGGVAGARFAPSPSWKLDDRGRLQIFDATGGAFATFDTAFTFDNGSYLVLEGTSPDHKGTIYQLQENR